MKKKKETLTAEKKERPTEEKKEKIQKKHLAIIGVIGLILLIAAVVFLSSFFPHKQDNVVATLNGEPITAEQLSRYAKLLESQGTTLSYEALINQTMIEQLLYDDAVRNGFNVSSDQLDTQLQQLLASSSLTQDSLTAQLAAINITEQEFRIYMQRQMSIMSLIEQQVVGKVMVDEAEVDDYYNTNKNSFAVKDGQMHFRHILLATEDEANAILAQLKAGADFAELAKDNSMDPGSAANGGELPFMVKEQLVPEFGDAAFDLDVGELSGVVKTQFGYHIIKRLSDELTEEGAKAIIRNAILKEQQAKAVQIYISQIYNSADIVIKSTPKQTASTSASMAY